MQCEEIGDVIAFWVSAKHTYTETKKSFIHKNMTCWNSAKPWFPWIGSPFTEPRL